MTAATTRIGRLADGDVVLDDGDVSRNHAVISDTGTSYVISDLRSANGPASAAVCRRLAL